MGLKVNSSPGTWERPLGRSTVVGHRVVLVLSASTPSSGAVFCSQPSLPAFHSVASVRKDLLVGNALSPSSELLCVGRLFSIPPSTTGPHS